MAGYHHVINRGVDQMNVFHHHNDKDLFLQIVNKNSVSFWQNHYKSRYITSEHYLYTLIRYVSLPLIDKPK